MKYLIKIKTQILERNMSYVESYKSFGYIYIASVSSYLVRHLEDRSMVKLLKIT